MATGHGSPRSHSPQSRHSRAIISGMSIATRSAPQMMALAMCSAWAIPPEAISVTWSRSAVLDQRPVDLAKHVAGVTRIRRRVLAAVGVEHQVQHLGAVAGEFDTRLAAVAARPARGSPRSGRRSAPSARPRTAPTSGRSGHHHHARRRRTPRPREPRRRLQPGNDVVLLDRESRRESRCRGPRTSARAWPPPWRRPPESAPGSIAAGTASKITGSGISISGGAGMAQLAVLRKPGGRSCARCPRWC